MSTKSEKIAGIIGEGFLLKSSTRNNLENIQVNIENLREKTDYEVCCLLKETYEKLESEGFHPLVSLSWVNREKVRMPWPSIWINEASPLQQEMAEIRESNAFLTAELENMRTELAKLAPKGKKGREVEDHPDPPAAEVGF